MIRTGLDRLLDEPRALAGRHYAILAHGASVSADLVPIHLALTRLQAERPKFLLGPEHGYYGVEQDMIPSANESDPWTGLPVVSLYGDSIDTLRPDRAIFEDIDLLVIDLQDVGSRYYTYAATAVWSAEAALAAGCEVWVLDRPNPLGGVEIEGNRRRQGYESFIGAFEIPVRHGLTVGELVRRELARGGEPPSGLRVWELEGWSREMTWRDWRRSWVAPSPNIPTGSTTEVFPGGCLVEATEVSEGRGTTRPFELLGAPFCEPTALADRLNELALPGCCFLPTYFKPQFQKHSGQVCGGIQWAVTEPDTHRPYRTGVEIVRLLCELGGDDFEWRRAAYEFESDRPAIDLLSGDNQLRRALEGRGDLEAWLSTWDEDEAEFRRQRRAYLLYPEGPGG